MSKKVTHRAYDRMENATKSGGWKYTDEEVLNAQKGVVWDMIKQMGQKLVSADKSKNMVSVSLPVRVFEPRSYLQRCCDPFLYLPHFLPKAAAAKDPMERLKLVMAFAVSGLHNTVSQKKPFNPILGETFEATYKDGSQVFLEQSCHHPPISNWQIIGPKSAFKFYGFGEYAATFRGNSIKGGLRGPHWVEFADGTVIKYDLPTISMHGFMYGDRIVEYTGTMHFKDEKNNLVGEITIAPYQGNFITGFFSKRDPSDYFSGDIWKMDAEGDKSGESLCGVVGTWLGCIEFDGKSYWSFKDKLEKHVPIPVEHPLPSDCRFREDLIALAKGDLEAAQEWKSKLEVKQRNDKKLRVAEKKKKAASG